MEEKSEKEGVAEINHRILSIIPHLHCATRGLMGARSRGVMSEEMKLSLGKGGRTVLFQCLPFCFPLPKLVVTFLF